MQNKIDYTVAIDHWVNVVKNHLDEADALVAEGSVELGEALKEYSYDDVPPEILDEVKNRIENAS